MSSTSAHSVLVTGATGNIGSVLVPALSDRWPRLLVLGRDRTRSRAIHELVCRNRVDFLHWDLLNTDPPSPERKKLLEVTDLIHAAAVTSEPCLQSSGAIEMVQVNVMGLINLLRHLPRLQHITYVSSVAVYGPPRFLPCPESHPTAPTRLYGVTKLAAEHFFRLQAGRSGLSLSVLRLSSVYGFPDPLLESGSAIPTFLRLCHDGSPIRLIRTAHLLRDYIHVSDVVSAVGGSLARRASGVFNIASGQGHSLADIARMAGEITRTTPQIRVDPEAGPDSDFTSDIVYDITRARSLLMFEPRVPLVEGMESLYRAFLSGGSGNGVTGGTRARGPATVKHVSSNHRLD